MTAIADEWRRRAGASAIELASWLGERRLVAPRLGSLGDRLARLDDNVVPGHRRRRSRRSRSTRLFTRRWRWPCSAAGRALEGMAAGGATTVSDRPKAPRAAPPTVAGLRNVPAAARLLVAGGAAQPGNDTVVPSGEPAVTRVARSVAASVAQRGGAGRGRVDGITGALGGGPSCRPVRRPLGETTLSAGELVGAGPAERGAGTW